MARVTKAPEERRKEIVETAAEVFIEKGFEQTQISDIAKRMNVSQGLVYHYFRSKVDMLYAVIDGIAEEKQFEIDKVLHLMKNPAHEKLLLLLEKKMEADNLEDLIPSITTDAAIIEYCSKKITSSAAPMVLTLIEQGNDDGSWNCEFPEETALFISNGFRGFYDTLGSAEDTSRLKKALITIIFNVLRPGSAQDTVSNSGLE